MNISVDIETDGICAEKILYTVIETFISHDRNYKLKLNITELPESDQDDWTADINPVRPFGAAD